MDNITIRPIRDYDVIKFAGGEIHVKLKTTVYANTDVITIEKKILNSDDVMELLLINEVLRRKAPGAWFVLKMPYIPYARQDRATTPESPRSLKVFAELINSCKFDRVEVIDPHSMVAESDAENGDDTQKVKWKKDPGRGWCHYFHNELSADVIHIIREIDIQ